MRPFFAAVLIFLIAIVMPPLLASQAVGPASCTMAGVWYDGSPAAKYMLTITTDSGQHYTMSGAAAFTQASLGYPVTTTFSNSIVKTGAGWEFFGAGMVNQSAAFPAPDPEVDDAEHHSQPEQLAEEDVGKLIYLRHRRSRLPGRTSRPVNDQRA